MAKKKSEQPQDEALRAVTIDGMPADRYEIVEMPRSALKNAEYNPRVMTDIEMRKLKTAIRKHGFVEPPIWNKRTGNLVSGHQRMRIRDTLAKEAGLPKDYSVRVAVIDVDETRERELNVLMNNPEAQGSWDLEKLASLFEQDKIDAASAGFDQADVYRLFGAAPLSGNVAAIEEIANKFRERQDQFDAARASGRAKDSDDFYLVVVFESQPAVEEFVERLGLPDNRYQDGRTLARLLKPTAAEAAEEV